MSNEVAVYGSGSAMILHKDTFEQAQRAANLFASSKLVPAHFQGKVADCFIGLMVANRMGEDPLTVLQNMYVVHGRPGWSTQYMIARANASNVFKGRITWATEGSGDAMKVTAKAILSDTGEQVSVSADMAMAKAEQWTRNEKYRTMPEHMLRWRSASMLIRLYAPEVMLGYQTVEEVETLPMIDVTNPAEPSVVDTINAAIKNGNGEAKPQLQQKDALEEILDREPEVTTVEPSNPNIPPFPLEEATTIVKAQEYATCFITAAEATSEELRPGLWQVWRGGELLSILNNKGRASVAEKVRKYEPQQEAA